MTANPTILALDAAGAACSAAVWRDGGLRGRRFEAMTRGQSERLVPMIEEALSEAKTAFADIDRIAVTVGPGGFTGVRIGLATGRGLALALGCPLVGFSNFEVLAAAAVKEREAEANIKTAPPRRLVVLIDAKREDLYAQALDADLTPLTAPAALYPADLDARLPEGPLLLIGDGVTQAAPDLRAAGRDIALSPAPGLCDAAELAWLAARAAPPTSGGPGPRPLYLRPPDATPPAKRQSLVGA